MYDTVMNMRQLYADRKMNTFKIDIIEFVIYFTTYDTIVSKRVCDLKSFEVLSIDCS